MKWINIPEGAESVGSACMKGGACVCLCGSECTSFKLGLSHKAVLTNS